MNPSPFEPQRHGNSSTRVRLIKWSWIFGWFAKNKHDDCQKTDLFCWLGSCLSRLSSTISSPFLSTALLKLALRPWHFLAFKNPYPLPCMSSAPSPQIMVLTDPEFESSLLISSDEGTSYQKYRLTFYVLSLLFHHTEEDWALAYSHDQKVRLCRNQQHVVYLYVIHSTYSSPVAGPGQFSIALQKNTPNDCAVYQRHSLFHFKHSSPMSKPGAYITQSTTQPPTVQMEIGVCYARSLEPRAAGYKGLSRSFLSNSTPPDVFHRHT